MSPSAPPRWASAKPNTTLSDQSLLGPEFSLPDLPIAVDDPLGGGQLSEAAGASGVVFVGADADLGTETELAAIVEAGAGVDDHGRGVDLGDEPAGVGEALGHDHLGMTRSVAGNMSNGLVDRIDHADGEDQVEIFRVPIGRFDQLDVGDDRAGGLVASKLDALAPEGLGSHGEEARGGLAMDEQGLGGVADAGTLGLGVDDDLHGHRQVGIGIDEDVTVPRVMLQDRHPGLGHDPTNQALAATRDGQVDPVGHPQKMADGRPIGRGDELHGVHRQAARGQFVGQDAMQGQVRVQGLLAAPEDRRVAALDAQSEAASTVTLGRLSKIMKITPSGTRICETSSPLGRRLEAITSPIGSGKAATSSRLVAIASSRIVLSVSRSTAAAFSPRPGAASTSRALASRISPDRAPIARAERRSQPFLAEPGATASARDASLARSAIAWHSASNWSASAMAHEHSDRVDIAHRNLKWWAVPSLRIRIIDQR